ncbi:MAG TPA: alpha-ketoacid dehydrogenase subunit beta [Eubacteriaceae bacterium]|jgi:pyruvate/2-oxoglutarate/acetoin dehydrogenase E1 component|nr:alpha-ketoacid dehydrogenase subunit beta [Eubacteriaceae bacterium]
MKEMTYSEAIRLAMTEEMRKDENIFIIGEDIGIYGGTFGVTKGMIDEFGEERIKDAPISEAAIVGAAAGAAVTGMRPIVELPFLDFITIGMDALVNQAAKMRYMFGGNEKVPMVVRLPGGSGTGAAAQHSQNLEAWFCHVPGLKVVAPSTPNDAKGLLKSSIRDDNPVVFIESKLLYNTTGMVEEDPEFTIPLGKADIKLEGSDISLITYGRMLKKALIVAKELAKENIYIEVIDLRTLAPLDKDTIIQSVKKTGRAIIVHEAVKTGGFGGEIVATIAESDAFDFLKAPIIRIAGVDIPIPHNKELEKAAVPSEKDIKAGIYRLLNK